MSKVNFHTRFNPAIRKSKGKIYDEHDNVDRLSYVDSTLMINRLINEGKNLNSYRAMALSSGSFNGNMKEISEDNSIPCPVFQSDPTIVMPVIEQAQKDLESKINAAAAKRSKESSSVNLDSDKTESSSGSVNFSGVASAENIS